MSDRIFNKKYKRNSMGDSESDRYKAIIESSSISDGLGGNDDKSEKNDFKDKSEKNDSKDKSEKNDSDDQAEDNSEDKSQNNTSEDKSQNDTSDESEEDDFEEEPEDNLEHKQLQTEFLNVVTQMIKSKCPLPNFKLHYLIMHHSDRCGNVINIKPFLRKEEAKKAKAPDALWGESKYWRERKSFIINCDNYVTTDGYSTNHDSQLEADMKLPGGW